MTDEPSGGAGDEPPIVRLAGLFVRAETASPLPTRVSSALRRTAPERWSLRLAELMPVLIAAGLKVEGMDRDRTARWALLTHMVAVLAGTGGERSHAGGRPAGAALHDAGYSEARLAKLLSSRGDALRDQMARLARYLRAAGAVPLDLRPLADLVLFEGRDGARAEAARLRIARSYYAAADRAARPTGETTTETA